jgi:hypothetical protein
VKRAFLIVAVAVVASCVLTVMVHPAADGLDAAHHRTHIPASFLAALLTVSLIVPEALIRSIAAAPVAALFTGPEKLDLLCTRLC